MNGRLVVDASIAVKWFLPEPNDEHALKLLHSGKQLCAPDLIYAEVGNVLWKRVRFGELTEQEAEIVLLGLLNLPLLIYPIASLAINTLKLSFHMERTFYDSAYLAITASQSIPLATADKRLFNALQNTELQPQVVWVKDISTWLDRTNC